MDSKEGDLNSTEKWVLSGHSMVGGRNLILTLLGSVSAVLQQCQKLLSADFITNKYDTHYRNFS